MGHFIIWYDEVSHRMISHSLGGTRLVLIESFRNLVGVSASACQISTRSDLFLYQIRKLQTLQSLSISETGPWKLIKILFISWHFYYTNLTAKTTRKMSLTIKYYVNSFDYHMTAFAKADEALLQMSMWKRWCEHKVWITNPILHAVKVVQNSHLSGE